MALPKPQYSEDENKIFAATIKIGTWVTAFAVAGILALALGAYGLTASADKISQTFSSVFGFDLLAGFAAAAAGALFGFIFGIPRTLDPASRVAVANAASQEGPTAT